MKKVKEFIKGIYIPKEVKVGAAIVVGVSLAWFIKDRVESKKLYNKAAELFAKGDYRTARSLFRNLGNYKLSKDYKEICNEKLGIEDEDEFEEEDLFDEGI